MSWKSEVTNGNGCWIANRLKFETLEEATAYITDLKNRWKWATDTRVVACEGRATYRYINGELLLKVELHKPQTEESHS